MFIVIGGFACEMLILVGFITFSLWKICFLNIGCGLLVLTGIRNVFFVDFIWINYVKMLFVDCFV